MVEKQGNQGLQINTEPKAYAPPVVRPILLIDGSDYNNVLFSVGARFTFLDFGSYRTELRSDVIVGSQYLIDGEYYHPFTPTSNWFVAPRGDANSVQQYVYNGDTLTATYRNAPGPWRPGCGIRIWNHGRIETWTTKAAMKSFHPKSATLLFYPPFLEEPVTSGCSIS